MCGGCYVTTTDRAHCGSTCAVCRHGAGVQQLAVRERGRADARDAPPTDPTGWLDPTGAALVITVADTGYAERDLRVPHRSRRQLHHDRRRPGPRATARSGVGAEARADAEHDDSRGELSHRVSAIARIPTQPGDRHALLRAPRPGQGRAVPARRRPRRRAALRRHRLLRGGDHLRHGEPDALPGDARPSRAGSAIPARTDAIYLRNPFIKIPFSACRRPSE